MPLLLSKPVFQPRPKQASDSAPPPAAADAVGVTPMMAQYLAIKDENPDSLLFYRMGDFYELFFNDAVAAAAALDIALTKRGKHLGEDIPMCGVPVHSHETYLNRLIMKGFRVTICEQTEKPAEAKKRGSKVVVRREVVRVVTPGTLTEDTLLDARRNNYLGAVASYDRTLAIAGLDVSTGDFFAQPVTVAGLDAAIARFEPSELLVSESLIQQSQLFETLGQWKERMTSLPPGDFNSATAVRRLCALYGVATLDAYGDFSRAELAAAGALVAYVEATQKGRLPRMVPPKRLAGGAFMEIDAATRRNLELTESLSGETGGSLLAVIDRSVTGAGARLLVSHLVQPLTSPHLINERLDMVQHFRDADRLRDDVRTLLAHCPDIERALSRLTLGRGGPRDLAAVRDGIACSKQLCQRMESAEVAGGTPDGIAAALGDLGPHHELVKRLERALANELPILARDGGFIAIKYSPELDELIALRDESRRLIADLQNRYAEETGLPGLKIKHNNVLGYFIEVPARQAERMPGGADSAFIHRQTMANAMRFSTVDLGDLEGRIARAAEQALVLEMKLFDDLVGVVTDRGEAIAACGAALAALDVAAALAELAAERRYVRPAIDDSVEFLIEGGRHPVVEAMLEDAQGTGFITNDCRLSGDGKEGAARLWLLSGPNMAGKSTFLRQNALIAIMAQMGAFVPATRARISVIDRLFSRVGATDDLARGRSTFMVEMVETATILNRAGPRSLVILDEIGRGTATFDGLSIAWAVAEHLHENNRCRALFATHFHELAHLATKLDGLACHTMRVKEWQGDVVFLHEVGPGTADRSYGIHVGQLAGLPPAVVRRAEQVLETLERGDQSSAINKLSEDLPLFQTLAEPAFGVAQNGPSELEMALGEVNADELTPRQALELVYRLKAAKLD
ncbi:MAG: DNA mismatch repair protein MutS [Alphaproteobacteria bacterium MarineAlpha3_Bin4]|nr:MAG: DNA mismatch repair protein MutS [Alphaproteobacteria bacterium MarineAlpha3_Bin4]